MKHTPGPWMDFGVNDLGDALRILGAHGIKGLSVLARVPFGFADGETDVPDEISKANAALIAAAPDLLAACEALVKLLHADSSTGGGHAVADARAAIAKAVGK